MAWQKLDTQIVTLTPGGDSPPPEGWVKLDTKMITLTPSGVAPPPPEKKFPWVPVIIGSGVGLALIGLAAKKRR